MALSATVRERAVVRCRGRHDAHRRRSRLPGVRGPDHDVLGGEPRPVYDGTTATGGKDERDLDNGQFHQNNGFWLVFDAYQNMTLESVKAYASGLGARTR